jgi:hypothetical protein
VVVSFLDMLTHPVGFINLTKTFTIKIFHRNVNDVNGLDSSSFNKFHKLRASTVNNFNFTEVNGLDS